MPCEIFGDLSGTMAGNTRPDSAGPKNTMKKNRQVCVFVNENRLSPVGRRVIPLVLSLKLTTMKREFNRGGRPSLSAAQRQKYIVSTRLDTPLYLQLKSLARQSGKQPAQIVRELIELG